MVYGKNLSTLPLPLFYFYSLFFYFKMSLSSFEDLFLPKLEAKMFQITKEHENKYVNINDENILHLVKRSDFPTIHVKGTKKRTCQNMNGVLGGSNAFNFMSFVAGVITLVSTIPCILKNKL